jgi:serine/threonine-protein kinase
LAKIKRHLLLRRDMPAPPSKPALGPRSDLAPGTRLGHYEIVSFLGEGAMGRVYRARDVRLLRPVAIKVLCGGSDGTMGSNLERFGREALAVARISHPNVVTIYDIGQEPFPFLAMELVEGTPLGSFSRKLPFEVKRAVRYALEMLDGLAAAHAQGIIHRDLKPENVMITHSDRVKLMDFGVAKFMELEEQVLNGELVGTPEFMAPEQIDTDFGEVGPRTDLFAMAAMLYYMLTGSPPFPATYPTQQLFSIVYKEPRPLSATNKAVTPELEAVCMRGLRKDPDRRFQTAEQFALALRALA